VYTRLPERDIEGAERLWRHGRPSGQRDLIAAVEDLVRGYQLSGVYRLKPGDPEIAVYVRPDAVEVKDARRPQPSGSSTGVAGIALP
jgi:hypothetical protein